MKRNSRRNRNNKNKKRRTSHSYSNDKQLIKYLCFSVIILLIVLCCIAVFYYIQNLNNQNESLEFSQKDNMQNVLNSSSNDTNTNIEDNTSQLEETDVTFTMTAIGDIMCHNTQYWDAYIKETNEYDFSYVFEDIERYIKTSDIAIGSLETSFAGEERGYSNYPLFNSPDNLAYSLKKIGLDVLSTAGNHCLDMGFSGLSRTIDVLDDADIAHLGTYKTQENRDTILFKYVKDIKIAFINYTYGTNGIPVPSGKDFCVNLINKDLIKKDIESAKSQNADIIVACMHWGTEYRTTANDEQKQLADFLFQNGVDIILGNHPHVLEPMEKRTVTLEDGTVKDGFVIYALGNFICDQNAKNTRNSIILDLEITKHTDGTISIDHAEYTPIYMYKGATTSLRRMKLLDIEKCIEDYESGSNTSIGQSTYQNLKTQLESITNIVGPEF